MSGFVFAKVATLIAEVSFERSLFDLALALGLLLDFPFAFVFAFIFAFVFVTRGGRGSSGDDLRT